MGSVNYYSILKVNPDASYELIKKSFKNLSRKWHPDMVNQEPLRRKEFEATFKRICEAFEVLSDPKKRRIYDLYGKYPVNLENGDGNNNNNNNMKVDDEAVVGVVESDLACSLEDLYCGCRKKVNLVRNVPDEFGELKSEEEVLKITINPGWKKGTKITFPGKGNQLPGSRPLDLVFVVNEKPHPVFQRDRHDLVMRQKISFLESLVGTTLNITTLDRRNITVEVTDIVTPGYEKVIPDEGMPLAKEPGKRGNLRIKFDVEFPSNLTSQQKHDVRRILNEADYN
ncbi:uncharacterized protein LOC131651599 [Vicia villosa]|uniref:uncharacterized protein LOC131651599 n=1 Tax=Vicia villosa TaxID=3911 RepID=UPI00273CD650|nr:uncharacterized protein LOC131651599 [Vicia villosa]